MSRNTRKLADLLHKGTIVALVGLTCYGMGLTGLRIYDYFAILRPATLERKRLAEKKLLESTSEDKLES